MTAPPPPGPGAMPVALVGAACRLPGGINSLDALWTALHEGRDLVTPLPPDRFDASRFLDPDPRRPGKTYSLEGGFLDDVHGFDAQYFGISPREAARMDPQQRLLLEMAVEALDDAGVDPARIAGSDTAVFVGCSGSPYLALMNRLPPEDIDAHTMTGAAGSNTANRLSHFFDLRGPSAMVDTACSSALTALHQACEALRGGRSRLALAAGIGLLLNPEAYVGFAKASMLSPTGRCRAFSADADGFVRAEGGGLVVLRPLADALAEGDRVHAVILAGATGADGRTQGLALPSARAQEELLRDLYARAGVAADELVYFEAHGTGTRAGDPAECRAVGRALGAARTRGPLPIGTVKSNLGHLEAASGMPGLLKACLVLRHGHIPATLHAEPLSPDIDFAGYGLAPAVRARPVPRTSGRRVVGVSSFGFGGANAHVIVGPPPALPPRPAPPPRPAVLPVLVTARSEEALTAAAQRMADHLDAIARDDFHDTAFTACRRRAQHPHRVAVLAATPGQAADRLRRWAASPGPARPPAAAGSGAGRAVFVFSGNGSQWPGMGADLRAAEPVFRAAVEEADAALAPLLGWSVAEELAAPPERSRMACTEVAQPALFAVQLGLVALLADRGVRPDAVCGHSVGEIAAACVAGALDLPAAARVVAARSRLQAGTAGTGGMAAVGLGATDVSELLEPYGGRLEVAAVNSARDTTVSGEEGALDDLARRLAGREVFFRRLDVGHPFHSRLMDPLAGPLREALAGLRPAAPRLPFASTVTGELHHEGTGEPLDAEYWWRNVRRPVLFAQAVDRLVGRGCEALVEIGPHPVLRACLRRAAEAARRPPAVVPTLVRDRPGPDAADEAAAGAIAAGAVDWTAFFPVPGRVTDLPAYPWQRERHDGLPPPHWWTRTCGDGALEHPLLGERAAALEPTWHHRLDHARVPWLADHKVDGTVLMPATGYAEMALAAGQRIHDAPVEVTDLVFQALALPWDDAEAEVWLQTSVSDEDGVVRVGCRTGGPGQPWRQHARGRVRRLLRGRPAPLDPAATRARLAGRGDAADLYARARRAGLDYGPAFRVLEDVRTGEGEAQARYAAGHLAAEGWTVHPALLDGALQAVAALLGDGRTHLPVAVDAVRAWQPPAATGHVHVRRRRDEAGQSVWDCTVTDDDGAVSVQLTGCRLRPFETRAHTPLRTYVTELRAAPLSHAPAAHAPAARAALPRPREVTRAAGAPPRPASAPGDPAAGLRRLTAHFAAHALARLLPGGAPVTWDALTAAGVPPGRRRLVGLLLRTAEEHGLADGAGDFLTGGRCLLTGRARPEEVFRALLDDTPRAAPELALYGMCGRALADVLTGRCDPVELLFSESGRYLTEELYHSSPFTRAANRVTADWVRALAAHGPADRPLRILEVGAGTGGTTAAVLPALPRQRTRYLFTDVSPAFLPRAMARFAAHDFVEYRTLDLNAHPAGQGLREGSFDLVVAANVLHATADLRQCLRHVAYLLADGGHLLIQEIHDSRPVALVFGLLDSFWANTDRHERPAGPLLTPRRWQRLLEDSGFTGTVRGGAPGGPDDLASVFLTQRRDRAAPLPGPPPAAAPGASWVIAAEPGCPLAPELAAALSASGAAEVRTTGWDTTAEDWTALLTDRTPPPAVVLLTAAEPGAAEPGAADPAADCLRHAACLRALAAAYADLPPSAAPELWLTVPAAPGAAAPEPATVPAAVAWGMTRALANECPRLTVRRLAVEHSADARATARRAAGELLAPGDEDEVVATRAGRFVTRVTDRPQPPPPPGAPRPYALRVRAPGPGHALVRRPEAPPPAPGPDEVTVEVRATGLNYRDVMQAQGLLPPQPGPDGGDEHPTGFECSGIVTAVGDRVTAFSPGDRVYALVPGAARSHVTAHSALTGPVPDGMDLAAAATLPIAYLTVSHGLGHLAGLAPGETVLVHAAAGGVGLAAVRYAGLRGARVIATAGTAHKRNLLRLLGVEHVADSRGLDFAEQVMDATAGRGVDVVLNSLTGEAAARSLELLAPGGRFVELGKRDFAGNERMLLRPFLRGLSYFAVDVKELLIDHPRHAERQFREVVRRVTAGDLRPLPHWTRPVERADEAYRLLRHSRHIGKVVLRHDQPPPPHRPGARPRFGPDGTYLVTGGLTGLGAATAHWLVERGARRLALVGRRGAATPGAPALLAALRDRGAHVTVHSADAADAEAMRAVLGAADTAGHPVRGVVHAAMHLDDAPLRDLDEDRLAAVLGPKVGGALVLDALTRGRDLDLFVLYSSMAALFGNPHQAPYVGANVALEALARARRVHGEAALAVGWGAVAEVGHVARTDLAGLMERRSWRLMSPREALESLDRLLTEGEVVAHVGRTAWEGLRSFCATADAPRLALLVPPVGDVTGHRPGELRRLLATAPEEEARALVTAALTELTARVLQTTPERVPADRRLDELGMDSLMAAEFAASVSRHFDCEIQAIEAASQPTVDDVAGIVLRRVRQRSAPPRRDTAAALPPGAGPARERP
ncbi:hypothetical protein GCM10027168_48770 [Streptomyces capparidis]